MAKTLSPVQKILIIFNNDKFQTVVLLVIGVFLFICSLEGVEYGFKLAFSRFADFFMNMVESGVAPFTGLAIGVLLTALLESSSAVIAAAMMSLAGMVAAGLPISSAVRFGVPLVFGANIGTTPGNVITLFGLRRSTTKEEFNNTIPGVLVADISKFLNMIIFFTLEVTTGILGKIAIRLGLFIYETFKLEAIFGSFEKSVIDILISDPIIEPMGTLFRNIFGDQISSILFFVLWFLVILFSIDFLITKGLKILIRSDWAIRVTAAFKSPYKSFVTGFSLTWLVGSSSIGTSLSIPMIATKMVDLEEAYPYLCGCSAATTMDLSQLYGYVAGGLIGVMIGVTHIVLNIFAVLLWLVLPLRVIPIKIAKSIGRYMASKRQSALLILLYTLILFVAVPLMIIILL